MFAYMHVASRASSEVTCQRATSLKGSEVVDYWSTYQLFDSRNCANLFSLPSKQMLLAITLAGTYL